MPLSAWVVTDGKVGDEAQCLGVTEALGADAALRRVRPRRPWAWFLPRGPLDPRERPGRAGSPFGPPWPDLVVASGRRAIGYLPAIKAASGGRSFTVCLKDPRIGAEVADMVWVPEADRLRGPNVVSTTTSPHRLSPARLAAARAVPDGRLAGLRRPLAAVLVGGDSRHGRFTDRDAARLADLLERLSAAAALAITTSRRTPPALRTALAALVARTGGFLWDGQDPNPFASLVAGADAIVVTTDSVNMMSEAAAAGVPVLLFSLDRTGRRQAALAGELVRLGAARPFAGRLEGTGAAPIDSTPVVAAAIAERFAAHRARLPGH